MSVFHIVTNSYKEAEKYLNLGWELKLTRPVLLRGINKEITEYCLEWNKDNIPIYPQGSGQELKS